MLIFSVIIIAVAIITLVIALIAIRYSFIEREFYTMSMLLVVMFSSLLILLGHVYELINRVI